MLVPIKLNERQAKGVLDEKYYKRSRTIHQINREKLNHCPYIICWLVTDGDDPKMCAFICGTC